VFYFEFDFRKHVIDGNSCDWLKFIVFVWLVCKQYRIGGEYTFLITFSSFRYNLQLYTCKCIIAAATASSSFFWL